MKFLKYYCVRLSGVILMLPLLTGCAAGSATAGYALKAREADCLTAQGEQRITDRVKREILLEWDGCNLACPCAQKNY
jgi:hypothetical protein